MTVHLATVNVKAQFRTYFRRCDFRQTHRYVSTTFCLENTLESSIFESTKRSSGFANPEKRKISSGRPRTIDEDFSNNYYVRSLKGKHLIE